MHEKINLLPDSKQQRQKEGRLRKMMISGALGVMAVAVGVPLLLLTIKGAQALSLNRTQNQIDERRAEIQQTPDITTMLTTKDHMDSLPNLYAQRTYTTNLLDVLPKTLPTSLRLTDMEIGNGGMVTFRGLSATYNEVEKFYKALLTYGIEYNPNRIEQDPNTNGLFTNVVVDEVSGPAGSEVVFTISANFDVGLISGVSDEN